MFSQLFLTALLCIPSFSQASSDSQAVLRSPDFIFRDSVREDLDDLTTVSLDAFSSGAAFKYIRIDDDSLKDYTWYCQRRLVGEVWELIDNVAAFGKVVAVPDPAAAGPRKERVVSCGFWIDSIANETAARALLPLLHTLQIGLPTPASDAVFARDVGAKYNCSAHLDINMTRSASMGSQMEAGKARYIDDVFPEHFYLAALSTHPDWDGHGFAAQSLTWGMDFAKERGEPATLIATPAGYPLYVAHGFQSVKNLTIETFSDWEGGAVWFEVMHWV